MATIEEVAQELEGLTPAQLAIVTARTLKQLGVTGQQARQRIQELEEEHWPISPSPLADAIVRAGVLILEAGEANP